jgi:hypothetical protein
MLYERPKTLGYYLALPQFNYYDLGLRPVGMVAAATLKYRETCGEAKPEIEAMEFYTLNHLVGLVRHDFTLGETLPEWASDVLDAYTSLCERQGQRQFLYIMSICVREARHVKNLNSDTSKAVQSLAGVHFSAFLDEIKNLSECGAVKYFMEYPPVLNCRQFIQGMKSIFNLNKWAPNYGGKPWGTIAECAHRFLIGETTLEMLVDTAYTLEHNGGCMYNKGMMYRNPEYDKKMLMILDCQRAGQMVNLVLDPHTWAYASSVWLRELTTKVAAMYPGEFSGWVDWSEVKKLGAKGHYSSEKKIQEEKHPKHVDPSVALKLMGVYAKSIEYGADFAYWPGNSVKTFKRVKDKDVVGA